MDRGYTDRNQLDDVDYTPPAGAAAAVIDSLFDAGMRETQRTHGNGLITTRTYDRDDNLVTDIRVETSLSANDRTGLSFNYSASGYDANKNVLKETTGAPMAGYSWTTAGGATSAYDDEDRLTYWERTSGATTSLEWPQTSGQGLTLVGDWDTVKINGAAQARTHGAAHELTAVGASSLSLDVKGNITQDTTKTNTHNYTWDFDNRMSFADVDGAGGDEIEYTYDALGRRVSKKFPVGMTTSTIVFTCMGGQVNSEYAANTRGNTPLCKYVYGAYIDEPLILIKVEVSEEEEKELVAVDSLTITETKYYYHHNRQYSVTGLTDSAKAVVERYAHTSYGDTTILAPNGTTVRTTSSYGNPYLYTGRRWDAETGLYYYRARYYDAELGRFIGRDPINYRGSGWNLYQYVSSRPAMSVDPSGLVTWNTVYWTENHHWFPQKDRTTIEALCKKVNFRIDAFVTPLLAAKDIPVPSWSEQSRAYVIGEEFKPTSNYTYHDHNWIENWRDPRWQDVADKHLAASKTCCSYLVAMLPEILSAYSDLQARAKARNDSNWYKNGPDDMLMPYNKPWSTFSTEKVYEEETIYYTYAHVRTMALLVMAIRDACDVNCPNPIDIESTVRRQRKPNGSSGVKGPESDFTVPLIVGSLGAGAVISGAARGAATAVPVTPSPPVANPPLTLPPQPLTAPEYIPALSP